MGPAAFPRQGQMPLPASSETWRAAVPPRATLIRSSPMRNAVAQGPAEQPHRHSLSFLATLAFTIGFFGARAFHTFFPDTMVFLGGIHFHHFWYGLVMMSVSGWLGIAYNGERRNRVYAVIFGLGLGFVGDEVGLLLTFGDYYTTLTFDFFVAAICFIVLASLLVRYWKEVEQDVIQLGTRERVLHIGIFIAGFSTIFFAFDLPVLGLPFAVVGALLLVWGFWRLERSRMTPSP